MRFEIAAQSIKGGRSYQEDTWTVRGLDGKDFAEVAGSPSGVVARDGALVVVADGMGGEGGGAEASQIVADGFNKSFFEGAATLAPPERLRAALDEANAGLLAAKQRRTELKEKSGSTLIAGIVQDRNLHFLSVGDSSIWRFRDEEIHRINILHERAPELDVRAAELDTDQAWDHVLNDPQRYSITAAVMGYALETQHRQIAARAVQPGDVLIFASDGIETLTTEHLRRAVTTLLPKSNAAGLASALVKMITRLGTRDQDNTTVVVVRALPDSDRTQILPAAQSKGASASATTQIGGAPLKGPGPPSGAAGRAASFAASSMATMPSSFGRLTAVALAVGVGLAVVAYLVIWPSPQKDTPSGLPGSGAGHVQSSVTNESEGTSPTGPTSAGTKAPAESGSKLRGTTSRNSDQAGGAGAGTKPNAPDDAARRQCEQMHDKFDSESADCPFPRHGNDRQKSIGGNR